jgi:aquaporin Z
LYPVDRNVAVTHAMSCRSRRVAGLAEIPLMAADDRPPPTWDRRLIAEAFGTFALVFVAVGSDTMAVVSGGEVGVVARAVAPALMIAALIYAIADASGAHFNPLVSLAFTLRRLFPAAWLVPYWAAQVVGAVGAALVVRALFGDQVAAGVSTPHVAGPTALAIEAILTLLLVTVILGTADRAQIVGPEAAIAVGATIALCGLIALPVEGASMNPARSLAPAIVTGRLEDLWVYMLGPLLGAGLAVAVTVLLHGTVPDRKSAEAAQGD